MSSPFLPLSSPSDSPLRPRRPSLDPEREILSTRGQRLMNFLPSRTSSLALNDLDDDSSERRLFLRRGPLLIGRSNPRYEWYPHTPIFVADSFLIGTEGNATIDHLNA